MPEELHICLLLQALLPSAAFSIRAALSRLSVWKYAAAFYPAKIIKTAELDPEGHYIFAAHPHGIFCSSLFLAFSTEALGFSKVGTLRRLLT